MFEYFEPMSDQKDLGFGLMASTFHFAATALAKDGMFAVGYEYFPICYLLRHSIELYLKSFIIFFHKQYKISFGDLPYDTKEPKYKNQKGEWVPLNKEHDLGKLFNYFVELFKDNRDDIEKDNYSIGWPFLENDFQENIKTISQYDFRSDYFRYPISKDLQKDCKKELVKKSSATSLQEAVHQGDYIYIKKYEPNNIVVNYLYKNDELKNLQDILNNLASEFSAFHATYDSYRSKE